MGMTDVLSPCSCQDGCRGTQGIQDGSHMANYWSGLNLCAFPSFTGSLFLLQTILAHHSLEQPGLQELPPFPGGEGRICLIRLCLAEL